jgi:predicted  nucleic acid-binding Zn-ribbon protein
MPRVAPAARIRLVEALTSLQRLRREMGHLSETDEDYKKKKRALEAVINELQSAADGEAQPVSSAHALTQSSRKERSDRFPALGQKVLRVPLWVVPLRLP